MSRTKHTARTTVPSGDPSTHHATEWHLECGRHAAFDGPTYEAVEDKWRMHVYQETGSAPPPFGDKSVPRWEPADDIEVSR